ncbi:MAG: 1-acyl-sn-glycerol-3-phosphate acyltransferase, partial [Clostridia bacterium]|nr:1-acyl-sn-glycerol-3-phosphate acyltransferase [Clostridia bacterium]
MKEKNKKKNKNRIGKPPAAVYYPAYALGTLFFRIKYNIHVDRSALKGVEGPAIVLAPHVSNQDHVLTAMGVYPRRPTFVLSEHFMTGALRGILTFMRTISKKMFCADTKAVMRIIRAVREGNTVILFPEGRLTWYGRSLEITDGTAELVKQLGVTVLCVTSNGAGRSMPKWAKFKRRGRIEIKSEVMLTPEQIKNMTAAEIESVIRDSIRHDEEKQLTDVRFRTKDTTAGADGIVWVCPKCRRLHERTIEAGKGHIRCSECGLDVAVDEYGRLSGMPEEYGISSLADWYEYCAATVDITKPLCMPVSVSATDKDGKLCRDVGLGTFTVDENEIVYEGTVDGEQCRLSVPTARVAGFPVTVADHIDVYFGGRLFWLAPIPDRRDAIIIFCLDRGYSLQ